MSVGVDAALSPAKRNRKIAPAIGEIAKRPVGADDPVRPWGNDKFVTTFHQIGCASCGSMRRPQAGFEAQLRTARLLAPKMGIDPYKHKTYLHRCIRFCRCVPPGGQRRPPHGCVRIRIGTPISAALYRAGGASPSPTLRLTTYSVAILSEPNKKDTTVWSCLFLERVTRLELATSTLARWRSTG